MPARRHVEITYEYGRADGGASRRPPSAQAPDGDGGGRELRFAEVAVLPEAEDNCAILRCRVDAGSVVRLLDDRLTTIEHTVLEGHRIAVVPIPQGSHLLSWGLPFGVATRDIAPGEYLCNDSVLAALRLRQVDGLPREGNFVDLVVPHALDETGFAPAPQVPLIPKDQRLTFQGFDRTGEQGGVGTRNFVALVPTSALSSPLARRLAEALRPAATAAAAAAGPRGGGCDGVAVLAHTEAAVDAAGQRPKNLDLLLRTLAGFVSHPNVAAALVVGYGAELVTPAVLQQHMEASGYLLPKRCKFLELSGDHAEDMAAGRETVLAWLPEVAKCERTAQPLSALRVALQCGGSDAFSGVSGNPAAGCAAKLLIEHGGAAVLAETDELIGAESYILSRVQDLGTAQKFLHFVERFKERFSWHGQSAESNPSGGNKLRGLYNIALKSLGAAKKKHAEVSLDGVLDYGERLPEGRRGYFFMDSPGNDLESIAGQVATGCNAIFFITGNGSITNFPFVPTVKIITTTARHELLERDMDFNAGRFQDGGASMQELGAELFRDMVAVASGGRTRGEEAGHSQVSIWREWAQERPPADPSADFDVAPRRGAPLPLPPPKPPLPAAGATGEGAAAEAAARLVEATTFARHERLGLVLPTSLCSGEIARMVAEDLNAQRSAEGGGGAALAAAFDRFVALPHTEGCGIGYAGDGEELFSRIMLGHLLHENVAAALLLEHGCEKTHNAWMKEKLSRHGADVGRFGFASAQLDGGNASASAKVRDWFVKRAECIVGAGSSLPPPLASPRSISRLPIALLVDECNSASASLAVVLVQSYVAAGGTLLIPSDSPALRSAGFLDELLCGGAGGGAGAAVGASLAFAQRAEAAGAHVMQVPKGVVSQVELVTGLVAAGAGIILMLSTAPVGKSLPVIGHPMVPVLKVAVDDSAGSGRGRGKSSCYDLLLTCDTGEECCARNLRWLQAVSSLVAGAASREIRPVATDAHSFQIARGPSGVSA